MRRAREALKSVLEPTHLRRTGVLALVVGTWLTLFNRGGVILAGELGSWLWIKRALNYMTPFVVANLGLISKTSEDPEQRHRRSTD